MKPAQPPRLGAQIAALIDRAHPEKPDVSNTNTGSAHRSSAVHGGCIVAGGGSGFCVAVLVALSAAALTSTAQGTPWFTKIIEAEAIAPRGAFVEARDSAADIVYVVDDTDHREPDETQGLVVEFDAPVDGVYYIWAHVWVQNDHADSFFVKVGPGRSCWVIEHENKDIQPFVAGQWTDWVVWNHLGIDEHRKWLWWRVASSTAREHPVHIPLGFRLTAGRHRICITGREASARLDKILITNDPDSPPSALRE